VCLSVCFSLENLITHTHAYKVSDTYTYIFFDLLLDRTLKNAKDIFKVCHLTKFLYPATFHSCGSCGSIGVDLCVCVRVCKAF